MEIPYIEDFKLPYSYNIKPMKSYKPTPQKDPPKQQGDDVKILGNGKTILEEVDANFESETNHYSYSYKVKFENGGKTNIYIEWDKNTKIDIGVFGSEGNKLDSPADNAPKKNSNGNNVQLCHVMYVKPGEEYLITLDIEKLENGTTGYTIDIKPCDNIPKYQNIGYNRDANTYTNELQSAAISSFDRRLNASEARIEERDRLSGVGGKIDKENQTQKTPEEILMELDISAAMKSVDEFDGASNGIEVATRGTGEDDVEIPILISGGEASERANWTKYYLENIYEDNTGSRGLIYEFADKVDEFLMWAMSDSYKEDASAVFAQLEVIEGLNYIAEYLKLKKNLNTIEETSNLKLKKLFSQSADEVNDSLKSLGYTEAPYKPSTVVDTIELTEQTQFVRVYDGVNSQQAGGWVMKAEDIAGLTPQQIQNKFALPSTPEYVTDVVFESGTKLRTGTANGLFGFDGGGTQFDLMGQYIGDFVNPRLLP